MNLNWTEGSPCRAGQDLQGGTLALVKGWLDGGKDPVPLGTVFLFLANPRLDPEAIS